MSFRFENFEQARNAALDHAYASSLNYDYLLFDDADMELVVEDADFRRGSTGPGYRLLQRASSDLAYWNTRLVQARCRRALPRRDPRISRRARRSPGTARRSGTRTMPAVRTGPTSLNAMPGFC